MGASSGGGGKGGVGSGVSPEAMQMIQQAMGLNMEAIHNRYQQLGLGVPGGDPSHAGQQAAASGTSLQPAGPSTMEQQDIAGQQLQGNAAIGELQNATAGTGSSGGGKGGAGSALGGLASLGLAGGGI
jgi:hypothetical protein